ncbi:hypothetical protein R6258_00400 [Halomonas sp. HP20-15]|uniref:hypothetical protein n=1 Tax=Halomonas sp. HP20-15 TaxID=3085901 RepID=UPI00298253B8|nr:hypothetical protein [Halomonas sp. HP20-15]MDW5375364.1 hypothetical protein [Halomonas sp. HP20-15]
MENFIDWKFIVPLAVSIFALWNSYLARRDTNRNSREYTELHQRKEMMEYYPILSAELLPGEDKVKIIIRNKSDISAPECEVDFVLRMWAGNKYSAEEAGEIKVGQIPPASFKELDPPEINQCVSDFAPILKRHDPNETDFVLRVVTKYSSAHPAARQLVDVTTAFFVYEGGVLKINEDKEPI